MSSPKNSFQKLSVNQSSQSTSSKADNFAGKLFSPAINPVVGRGRSLFAPARGSNPKVGASAGVPPAPPVPLTAPIPASPLKPRILREEVAKVLGFAEYQIAILTRLGVLTPLGKPARSAVKYYARDVIEEYAKNPKWLDYATEQIYNYWRRIKGRK